MSRIADGATGRVFAATEALDGGLVRSVYPSDELLDAARELAADWAEGREDPALTVELLAVN